MSKPAGHSVEMQPKPGRTSCEFQGPSNACWPNHIADTNSKHQLFERFYLKDPGTRGSLKRLSPEAYGKGSLEREAVETGPAFGAQAHGSQSESSKGWLGQWKAPRERCTSSEPAGRVVASGKQPT